MAIWTCVVAAIFAGCAIGGSANEQKLDAAVTHHLDAHGGDAPTHVVDAPRFVDAAVHDAPAVPDAGGGTFCNDNTQCGAGTCCLVALCVPGQAVGVSLCFPH